MSALVTSLAIILAYLACALFYQASERRAAIAALKTSQRARTGARAAGWAALLIAFWLFALPQGWERGAPIWIGTVSAAGGVSLLISALRPNWHPPSLAFAGGCAALLVLATAIEGAMKGAAG